MYPYRYVCDLLRRAKVELQGHSPKKVVAREIALDIQQALEEGIPQEGYAHLIESLRGTLDDLRTERYEENGRRTLGVVISMHPEYQKFQSWVDTLSDYDRRRAISLVSKGEYYKCPQS